MTTTTEPVKAFSFGGGVQSTTALALAARGELDYRAFIFANVGDDSEKPATLRYVEQYAQPFADAHGLELVTVGRVRRDGTSETLYGRITREGSRSLPIPVRLSPSGAPGTLRSMFSVILIAGRWAAERHPEALTPDQWTRDIAAEYIADTMHATVGQWAGHNRNRSRFGLPISASGRANRIDSIRGFFCDLIEWEWIKPRFDPRRVMSMPLSLRAQMGPNPRIIDDISWAKLMAAGLTLNTEDLKPYGSSRARNAGWKATYYPIEMLRAMVAVWLFGGCRVDEIRRLELDCVTWDQSTDDTTGEPFTICLLHIPQNKTSRPFNKPVDPVVGQLIDAWKLIRPPQPDLIDRKTGQKRQHLFCHRGQLVGKDYLNKSILPALCRKSGVPQEDSHGALTSHRARATIATQLLNAREPLTVHDLQQWLGHKHPASTRYYAEILQRTLTAAYKKADYFARNVRTIQVLIDRESILTGAAAGGEQPWKYYDLGSGYCSYDFFAKCPHVGVQANVHHLVRMKVHHF